VGEACRSDRVEHADTNRRDAPPPSPLSLTCVNRRKRRSAAESDPTTSSTNVLCWRWLFDNERERAAVSENVWLECPYFPIRNNERRKTEGMKEGRRARREAKETMVSVPEERVAYLCQTLGGSQGFDDLRVPGRLLRPLGATQVERTGCIPHSRHDAFSVACYETHSFTI
jgi:hypothetical protein